MKIEKRQNEDLIRLFLKPVKTENYESAEKQYIRHRKAIIKRESDINKYREKLDQIEAPVYLARLKNIGLDPKTFMDILTREEKEGLKLFQKHGGPNNGGFMQQATPSGFEGQLPDFNCKTIEVEICKELVCVGQPLPIDVERIWLADGVAGNFSNQGTNGFSYHDIVRGSSSWNWTYHRHSTSRSGMISIWASTELVEDSKVNGLGIVFKGRQDANGDFLFNGASAGGKDPFGLPPSQGRVEMSYKIKIALKEPGQSWRFLYDGPTNMYQIYGPIESNIYSEYNLLGGSEPSKDIYIPRSGSFKEGTRFRLETYLHYWVQGYGVESYGAASYDINVAPYINIESCSMQFKDRICVKVPN